MTMPPSSWPVTMNAIVAMAPTRGTSMVATVT